MLFLLYIKKKRENARGEGEIETQVSNCITAGNKNQSFTRSQQRKQLITEIGDLLVREQNCDLYKHML